MKVIWWIWFMQILNELTQLIIHHSIFVLFPMHFYPSVSIHLQFHSLPLFFVISRIFFFIARENSFNKNPLNSRN